MAGVSCKHASRIDWEAACCVLRAQAQSALWRWRCRHGILLTLPWGAHHGLENSSIFLPASLQL